MALIRAFLIVCSIVGFFLVGAPLQLLVARRAPRWADVIPRLFCRSLLWLAKVEVSVRGRRAGDPVLLVANHVSWIDILAFRAVAPVCFLAKGDVARWPIVSTFAAVQGTVFVDRRRRRSIIPANKAMALRMGEGRPVLLFPEGTTFAGPEPGPFRSSHLAAVRDYLDAVIASEAQQSRGRRAKSWEVASRCPWIASPSAHNDDHGRERSASAVAVQPAAIAYSSPTAAWIGDDALLPHLWRILNGPRLACTIAFGAPIACTAGTDRKALARTARTAVVGLIAARPAAQAAPTVDDDLVGVPQPAGGA